MWQSDGPASSDRCVFKFRPAGFCMLGLLGALYATMGTGCAVQWYDPATGVEHLWGIGHMEMKVAPPKEGVQAVVKGTESLGVSIGRADDDAFLAAGWHKLQRLEIVTDSTAVRLEWPNSDLVNVRVGTKFPFAALDRSDEVLGAPAEPFMPATGPQEQSR